VEFGQELRRRFGHSVARPPGRRDAEMELRGAPMRVEMAIARQDGTAGEDRLKRVWQRTRSSITRADGGHHAGQRVLAYVVEGSSMASGRN